MEKTIPPNFIAVSIWYEYKRPPSKISEGVSGAPRKRFFENFMNEQKCKKGYFPPKNEEDY